MASTEMVVMPKEDYQAICNSVRAKTGGTAFLKSGEVSPIIDGIEIGIDTSTDTPAEESHIVSGKVAFANGEKVDGTMKAMSGLSALVEANEDSSVMSNDDGSKSLMLSGKYSGTAVRYVEPDTSLYVIMTDTSDKMSMFGNATAEDVVQGKTFTSAAGLAVPGSIEVKTASNVTASGATVTVPAGYYASTVSKSVTTTTRATPEISVDDSGLITATSTQTAGYVSAGENTATKQLTTQAAQIIDPGAEDQYISAGVFLTGTQTIKGDENLDAGNIKSGVSIFGVEGTLVPGGLVRRGATITPSDTTYTIDTGLSELSRIILYKTNNAIDAKGLIIGYYESGGTAKCVCCKTYSAYSSSCTFERYPDFSIDGGTFSLNSTDYLGLASGKKYTYVAFGTE